MDLGLATTRAIQVTLACDACSVNYHDIESGAS